MCSDSSYKRKNTFSCNISVWKKNTGLLLWSFGEMWETMNFWWGKSGPAALLAAGPLLGALPISPALNSLSSSHWKDRVIISLCPFTVHIVSKVCPWWWSYCIGVMAGARWSGRQDMPCSLVPSSCQEGRQKNGNIIQIAGGQKERFGAVCFKTQIQVSPKADTKWQSMLILSTTELGM